MPAACRAAFAAHSLLNSFSLGHRMATGSAMFFSRQRKLTANEVLGVSLDASPAEIKRAFRTLALQHHPDKKDGDAALFLSISEAYEELSSKSSGESPSIPNMCEELWTDRSDSPLCKACLNGDRVEVNRLLAEARSDPFQQDIVNRPGRSGLTPLKYACVNGHDAIVEKLLESGCSVEITSRAGVTALMEALQTALSFACMARSGSEARCRLGRAGADRSRPDGEGRTAAHFARKVKNEAVAAWLEKGIDAAKHAGLQSAVQLVVDCG
ncbi:hypothetical protein EMIHUDRAFT_203218 [Emiliania huxleyi CCMP1516]|uniref:J domain-containing protein n=2 Tax=Emiliania huxleyi TaxID=2903 RepID=A0A0D3K5S2_EMIH1|nr:hypothetical protein EMIHUDRAFT_203218 [Emiliania huxleyi CCMP1516]EOD31107.1 hypothetical protein EMIHUDRAFT_203218 [Emiliania huxleyi CCMP1516]|eukprot:XP_005783536.1 hypothetical protein EMIHUDRAFT_203218 [Emiliania huxleyi CCMP1516]